MKLKCQCCGFEAELEAEDAFRKGWDAPPHFGTVSCCPLCPAVAIILQLSHAIAHKYWAKNGRPEEFGEDCVLDRDWDYYHRKENL